MSTTTKNPDQADQHNILHCPSPSARKFCYSILHFRTSPSPASSSYYYPTSAKAMKRISAEVETIAG
jgi:hypothetical protein